MDFLLDNEQLACRQSIIDFAQSRLSEGAEERDQHQSFYCEGWEECARFGLLALPIPREFGGAGTDPLRLIIAMEALGYGCADNGLSFAIGNHLFSCAIPILKFGTQDQKSRYLPDLARGTLIGAHAMTEVHSGSETASMQTTAVRDGDIYLLNGCKTFITNGPMADIFIVFAKTSTAGGARDFSAFIVEKAFPGFSIDVEHARMGLRTAPMAELCFADCRVPAVNLLGTEGNGTLVFNTTMEWERSYLSALNLGATKRQFENCLQHVRERRRFGRPIGDFQSVAHRLASLKVEIEMAQLMLYKVGWLHKVKKPAFFESAVLKLFTSECYVKTCLAALQLHGAHGYLAGSGVERQVRDSLASTIYAGTSEIQRDLIAAWLGLNPQNALCRESKQEKQHEAVIQTI